MTNGSRVYLVITWNYHPWPNGFQIIWLKHFGSMIKTPVLILCQRLSSLFLSPVHTPQMPSARIIWLFPRRRKAIPSTKASLLEIDNSQLCMIQRQSNIELFRIITMLLIVCHHYVVNSGLFPLIQSNPDSPQSVFLSLFGMWGKTGINCFVLISGYFMCQSKITLKKFL